jgi:hypothetical protein
MDDLIELTSVGEEMGGQMQQQTETPGRETMALKPADGGFDAWAYLAASFMIEGLVWGFAFTFGLFQEYYSSHALFSSSANIAVIGSCSLVSQVIRG